MIKEDEIIRVGKFFKPHGLNGEMNVVTEYDAEILEQDYPVIVEIDGLFVPFFVESVRPKGHFSSLVRLDGIESKEATAAFVNKDFYLRRTDVADYLEVDPEEIEQDESIIGYNLVDTRIGLIGRIEDIDDSTTNVIMKVMPPDSTDQEEAILLPLHEDFIREIDDESQTVTMELPEGLIET